MIDLRNAYFGKSNRAIAFLYQLFGGDGFEFLQGDLIDEFLDGDCRKAAFGPTALSLLATRFVAKEPDSQSSV